jgi:hypothetical protein
MSIRATIPIGSLRAVALDAPDIDLLATFYEQLAGWRRVPDDAALDIGATRLDGAGPNWRVYADPAGKPFCLVWTV